MTDPIRDRYDSAYRTIQALQRVPGLLPGHLTLEHEPQDDHPSWVLKFERGTDPEVFSYEVTIAEQNDVVFISIDYALDGLLVNDGGERWATGNLPLYRQAQAIVRVLTGKTIIPPESRRVVRDILHNAVNDARFHYRIGLDYILSNLDVSERWAVLDDADKWSFIVENYALASRAKTDHVGYMNSWRALGIPMAIMDIYDDAYTEEAMNLINGITGESS